MVNSQSTSVEPRVLREYQQEAVHAVEEAWAQDPDSRPGVVLPTGTGKQQPVRTAIPTPAGFRKLGELAVGDEVFTADGSPTRVTAVHEQGVREVFRMKFDDHTFSNSGADHLWTISSASSRTPQTVLSGAGDHPFMGTLESVTHEADSRTAVAESMLETVTTDEIKRRIQAGEELFIPMSGVAQYRPTLMPHKDPFTYGKEKFLYPETVDTSLGVLEREEVAETYLVATEQVRRLLLSGVISAARVANRVRAHIVIRRSGDCPGVTRTEIGFTEKHRVFADQLRQVIWSLGGKAVLMNVSPKKGSPVTLVLIFTLPDFYSGRPGDVQVFHRKILEVSMLSRPEACRCISVSHPSGLYLTGREHIVTHNSTVIAKLATNARAEGRRVVLLAHRGELLDQMAEAVEAVEPDGEPVGIVAGRRNDPDAAIVAASFQTLVRPKRLAQLGPRDLVIADECHHITADTYRKVLVDLGALDRIDPETGEVSFPALARTVGFTATMNRADGRHLGDVWSHVAYEKDVIWAIDHGFLVAPRGKVVKVQGLNKLASIKNQHGDYRVTELNDVMAASVPTTVDSVIRHATGRAPIIFAVSVDHAHMIADELCRRGFPTEPVTGSMTREARRVVYDDFRAGNINAMVTVAVLTEGADFPRCDTVVMARPTRSQVLYCQILGRALRPYPGKTDALVIDLTGSSRDKSMVTLTKLHPASPTEVVDENGNLLAEDDPESREPRDRQERIGTLELEDIDLLRRSPANWLRTPAGVRFLDARAVYIFVWPPNPQPEDQCMLGRVEPNSRQFEWFNDSSGNPITSDLANAVSAAEWFAEHVYGNLPKMSAPWRKKTAPSASQISYAHSLGIPDAERKTRARLSDDISVAKAARCIPIPSGWVPPVTKEG